MPSRVIVARVSGLLMALSVAVAGCHAGQVEAGPVILDEWSIVPGQPEGGVLAVKNDGEAPHQLVVSDPSGRIVYVTPVLMPGETESTPFASSGEFDLTDRVFTVEGDGEVADHAAMGMSRRVRW